MSVSKSIKITFWITTIIIALLNIPSAFFVTNPMSIESFNHLGVGATWFRWELEIAKTLAGIVLILPFIKGKIKEWAYVGLGIDFISAFIAITAIDGFAKGWPVIVLTGILGLSYWSYHRVNGQKISLI